MKKLILFFTSLGLFALFLIAPQKAYAQGDCRCTAETSGPGSINSCVIDNSSDAPKCDAGYTAKCQGGGACGCTCVQNTAPLPTTPTIPDKCVNQSTGDCTNSSLPQACSVGTSYDCCNTEQACNDLPGVPVSHANPSQQSASSTSNSDDKGILCDCSGITCTGVNTAIGCVHALGDESVFLTELLGWAMGIGGGIAFILMLYSGFMIMTSSGDPERLKAGQELLTSAISGLILLIFSVFILKFIGIDILGLCKFGFGAKC